MNEHQASATAYLIAESAVYLSKNKAVTSLFQPKIIELSKYFADSRTFSQKILYRAKQQNLLRPFFDRLENFIIPGLQLHYLVRKRRIEEIALDALADNFRQIVIFGAGFDTLAVRLHKDFPDVNFIEIDYPTTQNAKKSAVEKRRLAGDNLQFITLDIADKHFSKQLLNNNLFSKNVKTLFIAEGLLMYLAKSEIENLFDFVLQTSAADSRFAFTFMERQDNGRIAFRNSSKFVDLWLKKHGEPFRWSLQKSELANFLTRRNFALKSLDDAETFRRRYLTAPELSKITACRR